MLSPWPGWWLLVLAAATLIALGFAFYRRRGPRHEPVTDDSLALVNALLNREIERRGRSEQEKARVIEELEARNAEMERFTYTVSHDLKSPVVTIRGFLGMLRKDLEQGRYDRMRRDIDRIEAAAGQIARLLDELIELSRIGRQVNPGQLVPFDELVAEALETLAGDVARAGARVEVAPGLPAVFGDRTRLVEVVQNLIENGLKFIGDSPKPRIEIDCRRDQESPIFTIRDNGIGVDARYHEKIFGLFERLDAGTPGTGVGLALVKRIVELHGGRIWVESAGPGQGSTFCFSLPQPHDLAEPRFDPALSPAGERA